MSVAPRRPFNRLPTAAIIAALVLAIGQLALPDVAPQNYWFVAATTAKLLAFAGALMAALSFERGDYLRRAWFLIAANYGFITFNSFLFGGTGRGGSFFGWHPNLLGLTPELAGQLNSVCVIIGNVVAVIGALMLARAWSVAGLERSGSAVQRWVIILGAIGVAVALTGYPMVRGVMQAVHGGITMRFFMVLATNGGDALCFALVAPVLLTALALRGGVLWWPWVLYTCSGLSWMIFDVVISTGQGGNRTPLMVAFSGTLRALACLLSCAAGVAQKWAVRD